MKAWPTDRKKNRIDWHVYKISIYLLVAYIVCTKSSNLICSKFISKDKYYIYKYERKYN